MGRYLAENEIGRDIELLRVSFECFTDQLVAGTRPVRLVGTDTSGTNGRWNVNACGADRLVQFHERRQRQIELEVVREFVGVLELVSSGKVGTAEKTHGQGAAGSVDGYFPESTWIYVLVISNTGQLHGTKCGCCVRVIQQQGVRFHEVVGIEKEEPVRVRTCIYAGVLGTWTTEKASVVLDDRMLDVRESRASGNGVIDAFDGLMNRLFVSRSDAGYDSQFHRIAMNAPQTTLV